MALVEKMNEPSGSLKNASETHEEMMQTVQKKLCKQDEIISQLLYKISECSSVIEKLESKNNRRTINRLNNVFRQLKAILTGRPVKVPKSYMPDLSIIRQRTALDDDAQFVILTPQHTYFVACLVQACLIEVGVTAKIIYQEPAGGFSEVLHFVIAPQMFDRLPSFYAAFQVEQSTSERWFSAKYIKILDSALAVLDYSLVNLKFLQTKGLSRLLKNPLATALLL